MFTYLLFALLFTKCIESTVIREYPLTAEGLEIDFEVKNKGVPMYKMSVDIDEVKKTVRLVRGDIQPPANVGSGAVTPTVDSRMSLTGGGGNCPAGYVRRGTFCFPDDDY